MTFSLPYFDDKDVVFIGRGKEWQSFENFSKQNLRLSSLESVFIEEDKKESQLSQIAKKHEEGAVIVKTAGYPGSGLPFPYTTPTRVFFDCIKQIGAKTVGVTGTKGKTTTSSLIAHILKTAQVGNIRLCGNIGLPMLDALEDATKNSIFIVELSSFQLNELRTSPDIAVLTNLFHDHIDYHETKEKYWEAKRNIMRFMDEKGVFIYNPTVAEAAAEWAKESLAKTIAINPEETVSVFHQAKLIGDHNRINYLMAREVARQFDVGGDVAQQALVTFEPVRHRLQTVREVNGVTFVDDAIGSNPEATIAGLQALIKNQAPIGCVFLGGNDRQYDFTELVKLLYRVGVPKLVLFPDTGQIIKDQLPETYTPDIFETKDMEEAVKWAAKETPSGSICLLSTAAPSTVLWSSFEEKGSLFQDAVNNLSTF